MKLKKISPKVFISAQINPDDTSRAAGQGIKTIICNRPDREAADQPETQDIANAAAESGIEFVHIPVTPGSITDERVAEFAAACDNSEGPILAYCGSGMRATCLWALAEAKSRNVDDILQSAEKAGFVLADLRPRLEARSNKR
jgi:sulfide:quinone oxidoreductase